MAEAIFAKSNVSTWKVFLDLMIILDRTPMVLSSVVKYKLEKEKMVMVSNIIPVTYSVPQVVIRVNYFYFTCLLFTCIILDLHLTQSILQSYYNTVYFRFELQISIPKSCLNKNKQILLRKWVQPWIIEGTFLCINTYRKTMTKKVRKG